jgi:hypothetical protein
VVHGYILRKQLYISLQYSLFSSSDYDVWINNVLSDVGGYSDYEYLFPVVFNKRDSFDVVSSIDVHAGG